MNKLILPISVTDMNLLIDNRGTDYDRLLGVGISHVLAIKVITPLVMIMPVYTQLFGHDENTPELEDFVKTIAGLWQVKILANLGEKYVSRLYEHFGDGDVRLDPLNLAFRVNLAMPAGAYGLQTDIIFHSASSIMGSGLWIYSPTSQPLPEHVVPANQTNYILYGLLQILSAMCFRLTTVVALYCTLNVHKHVQRLLMELIDAVRDNPDLDFEPLLEFIRLTDSLLIETRRNLRDNKVKSLNLRVIK